MRARPKSRFDNKDGSINFDLVGEVPEYPEVTAWERKYADEGDRLAEIEAVKTGKRHWGRWYLTRTSLVTKTVKPKIGVSGAARGGIYDIALDRLDENWEKHMKAKNWLGEKGNRDLHLALETLRKEKGGHDNKW